MDCRIRFMTQPPASVTRSIVANYLLYKSLKSLTQYKFRERIKKFTVYALKRI